MEKKNKEEEVKKPEEIKAGESDKNLKLDDETLFWKYFNMGESRSLRKLAKEVGDKFTRIKHISVKNKWTDRINRLKDEDEQIIQDMNALATHTEMIQFRVANDIINSKAARPAEKLKALEFLDNLMKRAQDIKKKKKVVIKFTASKELQEIVDKIIEERCDGIDRRNPNREDN